MQKGFIIAVAKRSAITPKEATTVHVRQASQETAKTAQVLAFYSHYTLVASYFVYVVDSNCPFDAANTLAKRPMFFKQIVTHLVHFNQWCEMFEKIMMDKAWKSLKEGWGL